jgi:hypothetical protein
MDISSFDFRFDEVEPILRELARLAELVEIEPRLHEASEPLEAHGPTDTTYRLSCRLRGTAQLVRDLAALENAVGVEAVLDGNNRVRLRHIRAGVAGPG